jgi:hypothetical protein
VAASKLKRARTPSSVNAPIGMVISPWLSGTVPVTRCALRSASVVARHRTGHAVFIDKDQMFRIDLFDLGSPSLPFLLVAGGIVFVGVE